MALEWSAPCHGSDCGGLAEQRAEIADLKKWRDSHQETLETLAERIDGLKNWIMATLVVCLGALVGIVAELLLKK